MKIHPDYGNPTFTSWNPNFSVWNPTFPRVGFLEYNFQNTSENTDQYFRSGKRKLHYQSKCSAITWQHLERLSVFD